MRQYDSGIRSALLGLALVLLPVASGLAQDPPPNTGTPEQTA
jgi:hypothetical protein